MRPNDNVTIHDVDQFELIQGENRRVRGLGGPALICSSLSEPIVVILEFLRRRG